MFNKNKYSKKQSYEFCNIENLMVKVDLVERTVRMDDGAFAEIKLFPVRCSRVKICEKKGVPCIMTIEGGALPFDI